MKKPSRFLKFWNPRNTLNLPSPKLMVFNGELRLVEDPRQRPVFQIANGTRVIVVNASGLHRLLGRVRGVVAMFSPYNGEGGGK